MLPYAVLIGRQIDAIDLILGNVAVQPLNLGAHLVQRFQGAQLYFSDLLLGERSGSFNLTFDDKLRHSGEESTTDQACMKQIVALYFPMPPIDFRTSQFVEGGPRQQSRPQSV